MLVTWSEHGVMNPKERFAQTQEAQSKQFGEEILGLKLPECGLEGGGQ